jgi:two-component system OmpR family response regulator
MLEENVWEFAFDAASNIVDVYIRRLRMKLEEGGEPGLIETVRGAGYRLRSNAVS